MKTSAFPLDVFMSWPRVESAAHNAYPPLVNLSSLPRDMTSSSFKVQ